MEAWGTKETNTFFFFLSSFLFIYFLISFLHFFLFNLALNASNDGAPTTSLGNVFQCLIIKKILLYLNLLSLSFKPLPFLLSLQAFTNSLLYLQYKRQ